MSYNTGYKSGDYVVCGSPPRGYGEPCIAHLINGNLIPGGDPVRLADPEEIEKYLAKPGKKEVGERDFVNKSTTEPYVTGSIAEIRYYSDGSFEFYDYKGHKTFTSILKPEEKYSANFLWGFSDDSLESLGYEFANAKTEEYQKECWESLKELIKKQTMSEKRTLELTLEQARKLYKKPSQGPHASGVDFEGPINKLLLCAFTREELEGGDLPSWEKLGPIEGYVATGQGNRIIQTGANTTYRAGNAETLFATESQAKSALAMAQLSQLMKALGDECKVDSLNKGHKYSITRMIDRLEPVNTISSEYYFLSFKTALVRDAFLKKHEDLIKQYFEL